MRREMLLCACVWLGGCTVGPDYKRPSVTVPASFRAPEPLPATQAASLASLKWFEVFKDDKLQELIRTALQQNYDLRDAVARVEAARAGLGITRSAQFPNFGASGEIDFTTNYSPPLIMAIDAGEPAPALLVPAPDLGRRVDGWVGHFLQLQASDGFVSRRQFQDFF